MPSEICSPAARIALGERLEVVAVLVEPSA